LKVLSPAFVDLLAFLCDVWLAYYSDKRWQPIVVLRDLIGTLFGWSDCTVSPALTSIDRPLVCWMALSPLRVLID